MSNRVSAKLEERRLMMKEKKFDLQDRLIDYAVRIMKMSEKLPIPHEVIKLMPLLEETNELISILFKSTDTAKRPD